MQGGRQSLVDECIFSAYLLAGALRIDSQLTWNAAYGIQLTVGQICTTNPSFLGFRDM